MKFGILVAFSCQKRNQFFALTHREQLFKNQESITTTKIVRQNEHFFERMSRPRSHQRPVCAPTLSMRTHFGRVLSAHVTGATSSSPVNTMRDGGPRAVAVVDLCAAQGGLSLQEMTYGAAETSKSQESPCCQDAVTPQHGRRGC